MKNKKIYIGIFIITIIIIGIIFFINKGKKEEQEKYNTTNDIDITVNLDNGEEKVDWDSLDESTLSLEDTSIEITKAGIYTLNGSINNGSVVVNTSGDVKLILDNVTIKNDNGPALIIESANNTIIELKEGSNNILEDSSTYISDEYDGCLFSRDDLIIQGTGSLKIVSNYLDGIVSNDDLKIVNGNYDITSKDDGIRGKDSVYIQNGNFIIQSGADGIKSTNDTDSEKGYIYIEDGNFDINSGEDGIQAETKLIIYKGTYNIKTSDGSNSESSAVYYGFNGGYNYDDTSSKALKSVDNLVIKDGTFNIDSKDDAIHSNNYLGITNGTITISSGDDGIHADNEVIIDGGTITINKSYEGIEANDITLNGGTITLTSSDDGINVSGGNDSSSMGGRPGQNPMSSSGGTLTINGGTINVNADGDGLDANGNIVMNGGNVFIDGPTNSGNGALDYDTTFDINGGVFIAVGSSGMAQTTSSSSKQYSLMFNLSKSYSDEITIEDEDGNIIYNYSPKKSYSSVIFSSSKINKGSTYNLKIAGTTVSSLTASSVSSSNGNSNSPGGNPGKHNPR